MNNRYLWDRSGEPDPQIEELEQTLGALRHRGRALDYTQLPGVTPAPRPRRTWRWGVLAAIAAPAVIALAAGLWWRSAERVPAPAPHLNAAAAPWVVVPLAGVPSAAGSPMPGQATLRVGQHLETDASSQARLSAPGVGVLDVGPSSRLSVVAARPGEYRLRLDRGRLHAHVWAEPGVFAVDTRSATALDLGCSYTLEVDEAGAGRLRVTLGWVGLGRHEVESLVPRGAACWLRPGRGPGIPYFEDAPPALVDALAAIDRAEGPMPAAALSRALSSARPHDAMTVWHLLRRASRADAPRVYDRLAALAPPPAGVTRDRVLAMERAALDAWWNAFGLGDAELFSRWRAQVAE